MRDTDETDDERPDPRFRHSRTLDGILSRLHLGEADPELRFRLDTAFSKHHNALRAFVRRELRGFSEEQVEDTVQEVLLTAWRKLADHDGQHFKAWLFQIASHHCANVRRKKRDLLSEDGLFDPGSPQRGAYAMLRDDERERLVADAVASALDAREQEVFYMRYDLDLPQDEIVTLAKLQDKEELRVLLQRIRRRLEKALERTMEAHGHGRSLFRPDDSSEP